MIRACEENVLPEEIAEGVRSHVASCPMCGMLQRDIVGFDPVGPSAAQLRRMRSSIPPVQVASKEGQGIRWWPALAFASMAAIVLMVILSRRSEVSQPIGPRQATAQPQKKFEVAVAKAPIEISSSLLVTRGPAEEQPTLDEWTLALKPYKEDDYVGAIKAIGEITQKYPRFTDGYFYLGVAHLLAGRDGDAAATLAKANELAAQKRKVEAQWYLGAAYARLSRFDQAAAAWREVCNSDSSFSHQACEAIRRLNSANLH